MRSSNTFREVAHRRRILRDGLAALLVAACILSPARALDPGKEIAQYVRDYWNSANGFPGGPVNSIAQTSDGYLWVATDKGLVRYDGISFLPMQLLNSAAQPVTRALELATDSAGALWLRDQSLTALRYQGGSFEDVLASPGVAGLQITAMSPGYSREILFTTLGNTVFHYTDRGLQSIASPSMQSSGPTLSMARTSDGKVWLGTRDEGLFYVDKERVVPFTESLPDRKINCLLPGNAGALWIGTDNGLALWDGAKISSKPIPPQLSHLPILALARDRDSNLWIGSSEGLFRLNVDGVSSQQTTGNRQNTAITALFEDREGDLWVGDSQGLERIRDSVFSTYSLSQGLPSQSGGPIYVDASSHAQVAPVWVAPSDGGLYQIASGKIERIKCPGLGNDIVYSIAGDKDEVWIGRRLGGLTRLSMRNGACATQTYTHATGLAQNSVSSVYKSRDGDVWAGTFSGGVSRLRDGNFTTYTDANGLGSNTVSSIAESPDGAMWFATSGGLSTLSNGRWRNYTARDGLPSEEVTSLLDDSSGALWIGTANGLAFLSSNHIHQVFDEQGPLREPILGIAIDRLGSLWLTTSSHILRLSRAAALSGQVHESDIREFGISDGLQSTEGVRRDRSVVEDQRGRIWFSMNRGISVVDPGRGINKPAPAIAHIEAVSVDGNPVALQDSISIPARPQRITISYVGLSLATPDRVRYRYKLEGFDRGWSEPVSTRQVVYTNLGPGPYRFRLSASGSDGPWNGADATLSFRIEPALWQTLWFRLACAVAAIFLVWLFYLFRMRQITRQLNVRFEERLSERMRIAQELHDTLLQGFLSASMQLHVADEQVPDTSPAKPLLGRVLQLMRQVTEEGRTALQGLRSSSRDSRDLERSLSSVPEELALEQKAAFRIIVDGPVRPLHPSVRNEIYLIGREALLNAFRHARASNIEVQMDYSIGHLQMTVRDDGCGIDPKVVESGRDGHWGLPGMRERAGRIGAKLKVLSRSAAGTEVELTVPRHIAYQLDNQGGILKRMYRLFLKNTWRKNSGGDRRI
ncbi:sensor histidine kinase [Acidicapsa acidisoli]|uniref:sensor histidine kinase n=1 Tax=Acidicapsa acidisoli TaxID=1615681 RepID=UPI0021E0AECB|nr:sensor histidine kinase [Acidicapsa acidisoli]